MFAFEIYARWEYGVNNVSVCDRKSVCPLGSNVVGKLWTAWNVRASISQSIPSVVLCCYVFERGFFFSFSSVWCRFSFGYEHFTHIFMDNIVQCLPALLRIVCRIVVHGPFKDWNLYGAYVTLGLGERELRATLWLGDHMMVGAGN